MSSYSDFFFSGVGLGHPSLNRVTALEHVPFSVFIATPSTIKMQTIQYRISRIWEMKEDKIQKASPRIRSVRYFTCEIFEKTFYPNL